MESILLGYTEKNIKLFDIYYSVGFSSILSVVVLDR